MKIFTIFPRCKKTTEWAELLALLAKELPKMNMEVGSIDHRTQFIAIEINDGSAGSHFRFFDDLEERGLIHGWQMD